MVETHIVEGGKQHNVVPMRQMINRALTHFECNMCGSVIAVQHQPPPHRASCFGDRIDEIWSIAEEAE